MKPLRHILTWPLYLGWLWPLAMVALRQAEDLRIWDDGVLRATWRIVDGKERGFGYSQTFGRGMVMRPDASPRLKSHEYVHVRQFEDVVLTALVVAVVVALGTLNAWWLLLWPSGFAWMLPNFLGAVLRGGHIYRDAEHERSAYAQTDVVTGQWSWLDDHVSRPRSW